MRSVRTVVLAATLLLLTVLSLLFLFDYQYPPTLYPELKLPVTPDVLPIDNRQLDLAVELDRNGQLSVGGQKVTHEELRAIVKAHYDSHGRFRLAIVSDHRIPCSYILDIVYICLKEAVYDFGFVTALTPTQHEVGILTCGPPWVLPGTQLDEIAIAIETNSAAIDGREMSDEALDKFLSRVASYDRSTLISITVEPDVPYTRLVSVLESCSRHGLSNIIFAPTPGKEM
jgi:biopolymer transport protein ExbD